VQGSDLESGVFGGREYCFVDVTDLIWDSEYENKKSERMVSETKRAIMIPGRMHVLQLN